MPWDPTLDYKMMKRNTEQFMSLWRSYKPTICKIHGYAVAGGSDIALCCDIIIMAENAKIGYPPARLWGCPTTMMWVYRLGLEHAKQFLLTGRAIDSTQAERIGLVSQVLPDDQLAEAIEAEAMRFRHIPANQLALNKLLINQAFENMGLRTTQMFGTFFDGMTRHTEEAYQWVEDFETKGFRQVISERDAPWGDYGERPRGES